MSLMLLTGVTGRLVDTIFLGGDLGRREMLAAKAVCQAVKRLRRSKKRPCRISGDPERIGAGVTIEIWLQDEARVGQKNKLTCLTSRCERIRNAASTNIRGRCQLLPTRVIT